MHRLLPWWLKIGVKILLSRLPVPYGWWKRIHLFEHGDMNEPTRAFDTFVLHAGTGGVLDNSLPPHFLRAHRDFTVLELGPGDSLFSGVIAKAMGATHSWLVDAGPFATREMNIYSGLANFLAKKGYDGSYPKVDIDGLQSHCGITYLTDGVQSLHRVPSDSIDFCFSNAVLEHVPKGDFEHLANQLLRVLKPTGVCVHRVDLKDHLGGSLNNLRFAEKTWEGHLFRNSGFYTNRIRFTEMLDIFRRAGFACETPRVVRWESLPIEQSRLAEPFRALPTDELQVSGFDVVLRKIGGN